MKGYFCALLVLVFAGCGKPKPADKVLTAGVYNMVSQTFKGASFDTTINQNSQLQIYTDSLVMYARLDATDSVSSFGVSSYTVDSGRITLHPIYSAAGIAENVNLLDTASITKTATGNVQLSQNVTLDSGKMHLTEEYQKVGDSSISALDGVWKQISAYTITGKDTVKWSDVQYKTFLAGYFIYGEHTTGASEKVHQTFVSFGTFTFDGSTLSETIKGSNSEAAIGQSFVLKIEMTSDKRFTQTATPAAGMKEVIFYEKVK